MCSTVGSVQYLAGRCSIAWDVQYRGGYLECYGGYHDKCGGYHEYCGVILSIVGDTQYPGGYHDTRGR